MKWMECCHPVWASHRTFLEKWSYFSHGWFRRVAKKSLVSTCAAVLCPYEDCALLNCSARSHHSSTRWISFVGGIISHQNYANLFDRKRRPHIGYLWDCDLVHHVDVFVVLLRRVCCQRVLQHHEPMKTVSFAL